jgi:predicted nucleic-acid-binding protein
MNTYWVDDNILLRLITNDPLELAERAARLMEQCEQGVVTLKISTIVVAEIVWVLTSFYDYSRRQVADVLMALLSKQGFQVESSEQVIMALDRMALANVDFADAYLAEMPRAENGSVVSFDRDFKGLDIDWVEPS